MTHRTHLGVLLLESITIESRPVRIEPASALRRMASETVSLDVATDTGFEALPGGLAVAQEEELLRVVVAGLQGSSSDQSGLFMTAGAELGGTVAIGAGGLPSVGRRRVAGEEPRRVETASLGGVGTMAIEAFASGVTGHAAPRICRCQGLVVGREIAPMPGRPDARHLGTPSPAGTRAGQPSHLRRR